MKTQILIIDDEIGIRESLSAILEDEGYATLAASTAEAGLELIESGNVGLVLLDIWLGDAMDGMTALSIIKERTDIPVIMISGHESYETGVQAIQRGAHDFIEKPLSYDRLVLSVANSLRYARVEREKRLLEERLGRTTKISGSSELIESLKQQIDMVAPTDSWVLIRGERGSGKGLVARAIHRQSASADQPMIVVRCAAVPGDLIESELFGCTGGSIAGAQSGKRGSFDQADGSILFLDEIGYLNMSTQAKILRVLQEQKFERVGGSKTVSVKVRVIAATSRNLEQEIQSGTFRADLFYHLNVASIYVPRLSERLEDIPELVDDLMEEFKEKGLKTARLSADAIAEMQAHSWPGNVHELRNLLERLTIMRSGKTITARDIRAVLQDPDQDPRTIQERLPALFAVNDLKEALRLFERQYLQHKLDENQGSISRTAEQIGLDHSRLQMKLKNLDIID
jgi:two-component system nitrogen regulation response regulator NtrX